MFWLIGGTWKYLNGKIVVELQSMFIHQNTLKSVKFFYQVCINGQTFPNSGRLSVYQNIVSADYIDDDICPYIGFSSVYRQNWHLCTFSGFDIRIFLSRHLLTIFQLSSQNFCVLWKKYVYQNINNERSHNFWGALLHSSNENRLFDRSYKVDYNCFILDVKCKM